MCLKEKTCYNVILFCGILVALFGLAMFGVAIAVSVNSDWINSVFDLQGMDGSLKNFIKGAQVLLYIIALYLLIIGALAFCVRKKKTCCCTFSYAMLLPPVVILMLIMAIPILMVQGVSEERINKICAAAANDNSAIVVKAADAGRLLASMEDKAEQKYGEFKDVTVDKLSAGEKKMYEFIGPVIRDTDSSIAVASSAAMCREPCPCKEISAEGLKTYSEPMQAKINGWKQSLDTHNNSNAKNKGPYTGLLFNGDITNFEGCMAKQTDAEAEKAACVKKATISTDKGETAQKAALKAAQAKCASSAASRKQITNLLKAIETSFDCQGLCQPSTWWWYGDITANSPQKGCLLAMKQQFAASAGAAAIVMLIAILVSTCLCCCTFGQVCNKKKD